jgi:predicted XRE-type DNA-binding protein
LVKRNDDIRRFIRTSGLRQWMVAEHLGISEATFTRWLRAEMSNERKRMIIDAINELKKELEKQKQMQNA